MSDEAIWLIVAGIGLIAFMAVEVWYWYKGWKPPIDDDDVQGG